MGPSSAVAAQVSSFRRSRSHLDLGCDAGTLKARVYRKLSVLGLGGLASTGKAVDLKSTGAQVPWGFESLALRHILREFILQSRLPIRSLQYAQRAASHTLMILPCRRWQPVDDQLPIRRGRDEPLHGGLEMIRGNVSVPLYHNHVFQPPSSLTVRSGTRAAIKVCSASEIGAMKGGGSSTAAARDNSIRPSSTTPLTTGGCSHRASWEAALERGIASPARLKCWSARDHLASLLSLGGGGCGHELMNLGEGDHSVRLQMECMTGVVMSAKPRTIHS